MLKTESDGRRRRTDEEENAYLSLEILARNMTGMNFALCMEHDDRRLGIYPRMNQPCQGGEMRTYGKDSTRPNDPRPGDLRMPFPSGKPKAVAIHYNPPKDKDFMEAAVSKDSPYFKSAVKGRENVRLLEKDGKIEGAVFLRMDVDSTAFVNLFQFINTYGSGGSFKKYVDAGMTKQEALIALMLGGHGLLENQPCCSQYYFPVNADLHRLFDGMPHDKTGGTFEGRFAYNRPEVSTIFSGDPKDGNHVVNFCRLFTDMTKGRTTPTEVPNPYFYPGVPESRQNPRVHTVYKPTPEVVVEVVREIFARRHEVEAVSKSDMEKAA